jgi:hypothetical protein
VSMELFVEARREGMNCLCNKNCFESSVSVWEHNKLNGVDTLNIRINTSLTFDC